MTTSNFKTLVLLLIVVFVTFSAKAQIQFQGEVPDNRTKSYSNEFPLLTIDCAFYTHSNSVNSLVYLNPYDVENDVLQG